HQAVARLEAQTYLATEGKTFKWTAFQAADGTYALWLIPETGESRAGLLALPGQPPEMVTPGSGGIGALDEDGIPDSIDGYERLPLNRTVSALTELSNIDFGAPPDTVRVRSLRQAAELQPKYQYDEQQD